MLYGVFETLRKLGSIVEVSVVHGPDLKKKCEGDVSWYKILENGLWYYLDLVFKAVIYRERQLIRGNEKEEK